jgi:uncharacterized protein (UPF0262 family)
MTTEALNSSRLHRVVLDGDAPTGLSACIMADRDQAVADLAHENHFQPLGGLREPGPYVLHLIIRDGRLVFDVRTEDDSPTIAIGLALGPFRGLIKDYQMLVDSYIVAVQEGREARIQAIDMGRRGLHNEGAALMQERLAGKIEIDHDTARRLFTLVCVLHQKVPAR